MKNTITKEELMLFYLSENFLKNLFNVIMTSSNITKQKKLDIIDEMFMSETNYNIEDKQAIIDIVKKAGLYNFEFRKICIEHKFQLSEEETEETINEILEEKNIDFYLLIYIVNNYNIQKNQYLSSKFFNKMLTKNPLDILYIRRIIVSNFKLSQENINDIIDKITENNTKILNLLINSELEQFYPEFTQNYKLNHPNLIMEIETEYIQNELYMAKVDEAKFFKNLFNLILNILNNDKKEIKNFFISFRNFTNIIENNKSEKNQSAIKEVRESLVDLDIDDLRKLEKTFNSIINLESKMNILSNGTRIGSLIKMDIENILLTRVYLEKTLNNSENNSISNE